MRYFQLKKQTDSSSSWNSRPKPSLPAPPISCGLNCRCCRLQEAKNGGNGETTNKMKHQTKKQEKHAKTHKGYKFSESSRQNRSTENGGPCGCHQAYNPRSLGQNMQHRGNDKKSGDKKCKRKILCIRMCCSHVPIVQGKICGMWRDGPEG